MTTKWIIIAFPWDSTPRFWSYGELTPNALRAETFANESDARIAWLANVAPMHCTTGIKQVQEVN